MSIRVYQGPHSDGRRLPVSWQWLPWLFAGITIGGQIIWLLAEPARDFLTIATVVSFFLASASHAWLTRGWAWALGYVAIAGGIGGFEGNAQTLRILTRLEAKRWHPDGRPAGLNLTRATLDAATKYPWSRDEAPYPTKKFGVYAADRPVFAWFRDGVEPGDRCLEADVMDWSDDVAYSVHDVEDGIQSFERQVEDVERRAEELKVQLETESWLHWFVRTLTGVGTGPNITRTAAR